MKFLRFSTRSSIEIPNLRELKMFQERTAIIPEGTPIMLWITKVQQPSVLFGKSWNKITKQTWKV